MADIYLDRLNQQCIRVQPKSVHGILWLQTHFPDDYWDELAMGTIAVDSVDAVTLSQVAELSGLHVHFP